MSANKFKTLRHIETVRNFLGVVVEEILHRGRTHDQMKLQSPEVEVFEKAEPRRTYGSAEYSRNLGDLQIALEHHYANNRHHPEYFDKPCEQSPLEHMTLIDITEMLCDWKAASLQHLDGDIKKSIDVNQKRFGYSDEVANILRNTAVWLDGMNPEHYAEES